ncbi:GntR family transcriptional regulator [Megalodesulfovibrio gigas]|nr:GntR family transcriptional regulator [Megalodesulfovibrio gigas]
MSKKHTPEKDLSTSETIPIQHENLDDKVCLRIRDMIARGTLTPGQRIIQEELAAQLAISRTPLISALKRLTQEGLLEWVPRRGIYVRSLDPEELVHLYELRERLEPLAAELAAVRIGADEARAMRIQWRGMADIADTPASHALFIDHDRRFHWRLAELAGNPYLRAALAPVNMMASLYLQGNPRPWDDTIPDHLSIIDALECGDAAACGEAMRRHIMKSLDALRREADEYRNTTNR